MDYFKAFEKIKTALQKADVTPGDAHFAVQVRLTDDDCCGIFYIEIKDKQMFVEPYDYYDNDADVAASFKDFKAISEGKLSAKKAVADGKITVDGNVEEFFRLADSFKPKKAEKKAPAKKSAPKTAKGGCKKNSTPKKTAAKAPKSVKTESNSVQPVTKPAAAADAVEKKTSKKTK